MTGLDADFAAENVGFFTAPYELRAKLGISGSLVQVAKCHDTVVPISLGERLYGLVRMPKRLVRIASAGHNDLGIHAVAAAKRFIAEQAVV